MSVDDRLRGSFNADPFEVEVSAALREVRGRARRRRVRTAAVLAGAVSVGLVAAAAVGLGRPAADSGPVPTGPTTSTATAGPTPTVGRPSGPTPLDGVWTLGPVGSDRIRSTLQQAGLGRFVHTVLLDFPHGPTSYRMVIRNGRVRVSLTGAGGVRRSYDQEYLTVSGNRAMLEPIGGLGVNRYRWERVGDRLRLRFLSTSEGQSGLTPSAAFQRALYTVADWRPAGSS